jgi:hypothetical protein
MSETSVITIYDPETGRIKQVTTCPTDAVSSQVQGSDEYVDGEGDALTKYILAGVLTDRPVQLTSADTTSVTADGVDVVTISAAPSGASVYIDNVLSGTTDGDDVELTFDAEGSYVVKIVLFPYLDWEETISAT